MTGEPLDLGHGVLVTFTAWRDWNPAGLIATHPRPDGTRCDGGGVLFDLPGVRGAFPGHAVWQVCSLDPLDISPSLLCTQCGHHGWIRQGRWVPA